MKARFREGYVFREEPGGGILFNVNTGEIKVVEDVAFGICALLDRGYSPKAILQELENRYPDEKQLEEDLNRFLDTLESEGIIECSD